MCVVIRVRDLGLGVPGCDDLVVGTLDETGTFGLRLPNGTHVPEGCRMTLRVGRAMLRLALVPDDVAKLPRARSDRRTAFGILVAAALHLVVLGFVAHGRLASEGASSVAAGETMQRMLVSAEERAIAELEAAQASTRELEAAAAVSTAAKEQAAAANAAKTTKAIETVAGARITRGEDRHAAKPAPDSAEPGRERDQAATFGMLAVLAGDDGITRAGREAFAAETGRSAMGSIFGQTIDDAASIGGLGLSGIGEGGGGKGAGIPLPVVFTRTSL